MGLVVPEPGQQDAVKWRINSWNLRTKVAVVLVLPTVVALVLGGLRVQQQLDEANRLSTVRDQLDVVSEAVRLADLVALEMVVAVPPEPDGRPAREDAVDKQVTVVRNAADFAQLPTDVNRKLSDALNELTDARKQAAGNNTDPVTEAFAYHNVIADLGELVPRVVSFTRTEDLDDRASNVLSMLLLRASLAMEEALIASGRGRPVSSDVAASVQHSAAEEVVLGQQLSLAIPAADLPEFVSATRTWSARRDAIQTAIAKDRTTDLQKLLPDLQTEQTALRGLIGERYDELVDTVATRTNQARSDALRDAAIVLGALLAALAIALTVARSLMLPVRRLRAAALSVAHDKLPKTVERVRAGELVDWRTVEPMSAPTDEEIGQLGRAFDDMHQQAVRLAGEQAELRLQVSEMFMTLSRRSQSLVELQLGVIENLEADEHDPRRLEGLFRLDHLATRLRRNGENLQVLAGGAPPKRGNRAVSVVELLRASTSEVKDYRRVSLGHAPNASVRATAATDIVHILAELLENATRYSPPERKVVLTADRGTDGGLLFEVIDAGLGMAPDDLESANQRLDTTDAIGPETTRRMGLFVISLLAARHGVTVRLRPTYDRAKQSGITASVHVPGPLVLSDGSPQATSAEPAAEPAQQLVPITSGAASGPLALPAVPPIPPGNGSKIGWFTPFVAVEDTAATDTTRPATTMPAPGWLTPVTPTTTPETSPETVASTAAAPAAKPRATPAAPVEKSPVPQPTMAKGNGAATKNGSSATKSVPDTEPPTIRTTAAGLPMRDPGSKSLPPKGTAKPATDRPGSGFRDPDAIRNNLARHYSGVQAARRAREEPGSESDAGQKS